MVYISIKELVFSLTGTQLSHRLRGLYSLLLEIRWYVNVWMRLRPLPGAVIATKVRDIYLPAKLALLYYGVHSIIVLQIMIPWAHLVPWHHFYQSFTKSDTLSCVDCNSCDTGWSSVIKIRNNDWRCQWGHGNKVTEMGWPGSGRSAVLTIPTFQPSSFMYSVHSARN